MTLVAAIDVTDDEFKKVIARARRYGSDREISINIGTSQPLLDDWSKGQRIPPVQVHKNAFYERLKIFIRTRENQGVRD